MRYLLTKSERFGNDYCISPLFSETQALSTNLLQITTFYIFYTLIHSLLQCLKFVIRSQFYVLVSRITGIHICYELLPLKLITITKELSVASRSYHPVSTCVAITQSHEIPSDQQNQNIRICREATTLITYVLCFIQNTNTAYSVQAYVHLCVVS